VGVAVFVVARVGVGLLVGVAVAVGGGVWVGVGLSVGVAVRVGVDVDVEVAATACAVSVAVAVAGGTCAARALCGAKSNAPRYTAPPAPTSWTPKTSATASALDTWSTEDARPP
jgi:hypothetical protein